MTVVVILVDGRAAMVVVAAIANHLVCKVEKITEQLGLGVNILKVSISRNTGSDSGPGV